MPRRANRDDRSETMRVAELSRRLGIPERTLRHHAATTGYVAGIPVIRVGTTMRFSRVLVERVLRGEKLDAA